MKVLALASALWLAQAPGARWAAAETTEVTCAERVVARVQTRYERVRDFRARFEQSTERVGFPGEIPDALKAGGEVFFQKPGRMRWDYTRPAKSLVVSNGVGAWVYDPDAAEAQYFELGGEFLSGPALQFLLGEGQLLDAFRVRSSRCEGEASVVLELLPREPASFERLDLVVGAESGTVTETRVVDLLGNRTRLHLIEPRFGDTKPAAFFEFEPPPGTRVLTLPARRTP